MKQHPVMTMDLPMMENDGRTLTLGSKLLVTDNLDGLPAHDGTDTTGDAAGRFPMKLSAACLVVVIKGSVRFSVNLRDFVATASTCLIATEGTIVEDVTHEAD